MLQQMHHFMITTFEVEWQVVPEAVDSINGHIFASFKFLRCDTGSQELMWMLISYLVVWCLGVENS